MTDLDQQRVDTPQDMAAIKRLAVRQILGGGSVGILLAVIVWQGIHLLNIFVPIWTQHFADDRLTQIQQTSAMTQMAGAMKALNDSVQAQKKEIVDGVAAAACSKKR